MKCENMREEKKKRFWRFGKKRSFRFNESKQKAGTKNKHTVSLIQTTILLRRHIKSSETT